MALFRLIVEQRVLANLLFFVLLAAGFLVVQRMPVEEYPNVAMDKIQVMVPWPGASPDDVERVLATELEDKLRGVAGIEWVQSSAYPDRCEVWLKVQDKILDFQSVYRDVQTEVSKLRDLPDGVEEAIVKKIDVEEMGPSVQVVVGWSGDEDLEPGAIEERLRAIAESLRARVEQVFGVKKVRIYGVRDRELRIKVDPRALEHFDLDIAEVAAAIGARNVTMPAGRLARQRMEMSVRSRSELPSLEAYTRIALRSDEGGPTARLGDVATLEWGFVEESVRPHYRGQRCITLAVVKEPEANALEVVAAVREVLDQARALNPPGVAFETIADTTVRIRERIAVLRTNILLGLALVLIVLWMSIGFKNAILGSLGIPFSFLCSLILLSIGGESINLISLFSLVLVLGVIVDDALVVIENIHRHFEEGAPLKEAIVKGSAEVAVPVVSATLTTIAAFLPLLLMPGTTGRFFAIIPKTVAYALLASLFECLIILPVHIYDFGGLGKKRREGGASPGLLRLRRMYLGALELCLRLRYLAVLALVALAVAAAAILGRVPVLFFPSDFKQFFINVRMPVGTPLDETDRVTRRIGAILGEMPRSEVESSTCSVGLLFDENYKPLGGGHRAQFFVTTASGPERRLSLEEIMAEVRERIAAAGFFEAAIEVVELNDGPPVGKPVTIRFRGDDLTALQARAETVAAGLKNIRGVVGVDIDLREGKPELRFVLDEDRAARLGISAAAVGRALAAANDGVVATSWRRPGDDDAADVRVILRDQDRRLRGDLEKLKLRNRFGTLTPLSEVARVERGTGLAGIHRFDGQRAVTVTADVEPEQLTAARANVLARELVEALPEDASIVADFEGEFAETQRSFESLKISFVVAIGSIFMVLGAQFRSFLQPLVVLVTVPFSFIGVVLGLWLTGDPFTVMSGIAIVGLAGMVVNDSLVLVDFINRRRREGASVVAAVRASAIARMRAILLTTITTVFGVLPMALGIGGRSTVWSPMATSIAFGLSFATLLTLFVIPALYLILEDALALIGRGEAPVFDEDWRMLGDGNFDKTLSEIPERTPLPVSSGGEQGHG